MTVPVLRTITINEALDILRSRGMKISRETLCAGIEQGTFKFGDHVKRDNDVYYIYVSLLNKWMADRMVEEEVPVIPVLPQE